MSKHIDMVYRPMLLKSKENLLECNPEDLYTEKRKARYFLDTGFDKEKCRHLQIIDNFKFKIKQYEDSMEFLNGLHDAANHNWNLIDEHLVWAVNEQENAEKEKSRRKQTRKKRKDLHKQEQELIIKLKEIRSKQKEISGGAS